MKNYISVLDVIDKTVQQFGEKDAVMDENSSFSWKELKKNALGFSKAILDTCKVEESGYPIAVFSEKSVWLLASIMGINYAGGFYVYINPEQPAERIKKILEVLEPKMCLVDDDLLKKFEKANDNFKVISFSKCREYVDREDLDEKLLGIRDKVGSTTPLYGIFTSGSTGVPKCVVVSHQSAIDFISHFVDIFEFTSEDVIGNQAPFDFDVSIKDIVTAYFTGAKLVLIPRTMFIQPPVLMDYLADNKVSSLTWAVSALCIISRLKCFDYRKLPDVKRVMFSGEVMPVNQLCIWQDNVPNARFVNLYGPSEITCNCTYYDITRRFNADEKIPLGKIFPGRKVFLLDENGNVITKPDNAGEICVTGQSLAIGYYHNEEQTKLHFVSFKQEDGSVVRMYKTGDLAKISEDGEMYFAGRKDFQIKHMGHRIELEEIERGINSMPNVEQSVCKFDFDKSKITAYYVGNIEKNELRAFLKEKLPAYMIPNKFVQMKEFVLNKNGKIDRTKLA